MEERHEERRQKKKGLPQRPRYPPSYKTPPRTEILLQIYQKTTKEFQRDISFQLYQELLGYEVVAWRKSNTEKTKPAETPTSGIEEPDDEETPLDRKKRGKRKLTLRSGACSSKLEAITQVVSAKKMSAII